MLPTPPVPRNVPVLLRLGGIVLLAGGLILLVVAVIPVGGGRGDPLPVQPDTPVALPSPGLFGSTLVLYGRTDGRPLAFFGQTQACKVTGATGRSVGPKLSTADVGGKAEKTIGADTLAPLATVSGFPSRSFLTCSGPTIRASQPLYLLNEGRSLPRAFAATSAALSSSSGLGRRQVTPA